MRATESASPASGSRGETRGEAGRVEGVRAHEEDRDDGEEDEVGLEGRQSLLRGDAVDDLLELALDNGRLVGHVEEEEERGGEVALAGCR